MPLSDSDRYRLHAGPYAPPRTKIGGFLTCRLRGRVKVVAMSDGLIQWPIVVRPNGGGRGLALCGDLVRAARHESTQAIQHWWGVKANTVWTWRKTLGVDQNNAGTRKLRSKWWREGGTGEANRPGREATFGDPARWAKIAAAVRKRYAKSPPVPLRPWAPEEDALLGTMPDRAVAKQLGRSAAMVTVRRVRLGIESFRKKTRGW